MEGMRLCRGGRADHGEEGKKRGGGIFIGKVKQFRGRWSREWTQRSGGEGLRGREKGAGGGSGERGWGRETDQERGRGRIRRWAIRKEGGTGVE